MQTNMSTQETPFNVGKLWTANCADSNSWIINIGWLRYSIYIFPWQQLESTSGHVPLMYCSCLAALRVSRWRNLPTLAICVCKLAGAGLNVGEHAGKVKSHPETWESSYVQFFWPRYCRKTFRVVDHAHLCTSRSVCNLAQVMVFQSWPHQVVGLVWFWPDQLSWSF